MTTGDVPSCPICGEPMYPQSSHNFCIPKRVANILASPPKEEVDLKEYLTGELRSVVLAYKKCVDSGFTPEKMADYGESFDNSIKNIIFLFMHKGKN